MLTPERQPDAYKHPRHGIVYRGWADRLCSFPSGRPLTITADRAREIERESTPLYLSEDAR